MLFDSHCHLNFEAFDNNWQDVIADCQAKDIWLINIGAQLTTTKKSIEIADKYDQGVYAAIGLHPIHVEGSNFHPEIFDLKKYSELIKSSEKVVAIGETGIDFFHDDKNFDQQKAIFIKHINLAKEFNKALVIHSRDSKDGKKDAYKEILKIIKKEKPARGVIHCFGGSLEEAQSFLDLGFYVGFTGIITFKTAKNLAKIVSELPLEKILIETDAPYLAPEPHRGQQNLPQYVEFVAQKVAEIKNISFEQVAEQTRQNAINLYSLV